MPSKALEVSLARVHGRARQAVIGPLVGETGHRGLGHEVIGGCTACAALYEDAKIGTNAVVAGVQVVEALTPVWVDLRARLEPRVEGDAVCFEPSQARLAYARVEIRRRIGGSYRDHGRHPLRSPT